MPIFRSTNLPDKRNATASASAAATDLLVIAPSPSDGDHSASSTFDVNSAAGAAAGKSDNNNKTLPLHTQSEQTHCDDRQQRGQQRRRVWFNEEANQYAAASLQHQDDEDLIDTLWYNEYEYDQFKDNHVQAVKHIIRVEQQAEQKHGSKAYRQVLDRVYRTCCSASSSSSPPESNPETILTAANDVRLWFIGPP